MPRNSAARKIQKAAIKGGKGETRPSNANKVKDEQHGMHKRDYRKFRFSEENRAGNLKTSISLSAQVQQANLQYICPGKFRQKRLKHK
jgi:hypothetical protein